MKSNNPSPIAIRSFIMMLFSIPVSEFCDREHQTVPGKPKRRSPRTPGARAALSLILGDGGQFPNLFFYSCARPAPGPFAATFETHKPAGAAGDDRGYVSYNKGVNDPEHAGTRACSAALRSLFIQIYGAAVLEDPVFGGEEGSTKPRGITACIVSTARRANEQKSLFCGPVKCTARIITTFHDFASATFTLTSKFAPQAVRRRTAGWGTCAKGPKLTGPLPVFFSTSAT